MATTKACNCGGHGGDEVPVQLLLKYDGSEMKSCLRHRIYNNLRQKWDSWSRGNAYGNLSQNAAAFQIASDGETMLAQWKRERSVEDVAFLTAEEEKLIQQEIDETAPNETHIAQRKLTIEVRKAAAEAEAAQDEASIELVHPPKPVQPKEHSAKKPKPAIKSSRRKPERGSSLPPSRKRKSKNVIYSSEYESREASFTPSDAGSLPDASSPPPPAKKQKVENAAPRRRGRPSNVSLATPAPKLTRATPAPKTIRIPAVSTPATRTDPGITEATRMRELLESVADLTGAAGKDIAKATLRNPFVWKGGMDGTFVEDLTAVLKETAEAHEKYKKET